MRNARSGATPSFPKRSTASLASLSTQADFISDALPHRHQLKTHIEWALLAFRPGFLCRILSRLFVNDINGSNCVVVSGRDNGATKEPPHAQPRPAQDNIARYGKLRARCQRAGKLRPPDQGLGSLLAGNR